MTYKAAAGSGSYRPLQCALKKVSEQFINDSKKEYNSVVAEINARNALPMKPDDRPDDCPRCRYRKGCPYGQVYYGLQMHRCNQGIFELDPEMEAKK